MVVLNLGFPMESSGKPYKILMPGLPPENLECGIGIGILKSSPRDLMDSQGWESLERQELQLGRLILLFSGPFYFPMQQ